VGWDGESSRFDLGQMGTEIFFGKSEIRLDSPVNKRPDGQIKGASRSGQLRVGHIETDHHNGSLHERRDIAHSEMPR
jgi:hypothetical protein